MDKDYFNYLRACVDEYGADSIGVPPDRLGAMLAWIGTTSPGQPGVPAVPDDKPDKKLSVMLVADTALSTVVEFRRNGVVVGRAVIA